MMDGTKILNKAMKQQNIKATAKDAVIKSCYLCGFSKEYAINQAANCPFCNQPLRAKEEWRELEFNRLKNK